MTVTVTRQHGDTEKEPHSYPTGAWTDPVSPQT